MNYTDLEAILANIQIELLADELNKIPTTGQLLCISNRPMGIIEELILYKLLIQKRKDFFYFNNTQLNDVRGLSLNHFVENEYAEIDEVLQQQQCFVMFPVGKISTYKANKKGYVDSQWNKTLIKKIYHQKSQVLPFYISIDNNEFHQLIPFMENKMMDFYTIIEFIKTNKVVFKVRIGNPIKTTNWHFENSNQYGRFLRAKLYSLSSKLKVDLFFNEHKMVADIIDPIDKELIDEELKAIESTNCIGEQNNFKVFICKAKKIPNTINEIGRLRELAFRKVGEGTNKPIDLDEYDIHYLHIFIYDTVQKQIAGAYRLGDGSYIMKTTGRKGFYLNSLFKIKKEFSLLLEDSIELGRSFVAVDYQNQRLPLFLLWKGIAYFINNHPHIKYVLGPVSISNSYTTLSKSLIVDFIRKFHWDKFLSQFIRPKSPFNATYEGLDYEILIESTQNSIKTLEEIIEDIDPKHKKIPILLKKYFAQNARILCFNVDPHFNNALDGFMLIDIRDIPKDTLDTFVHLKEIEYDNN